MRQITTSLVLLLTLFTLAGCGKSAAQKRTELMGNLKMCGLTYDTYKMTIGEAPPNMEKFLEFAKKGGDDEAIKVVQAEGFVFNFDIKPGSTKSKTVLAESSQHDFKLFLDGRVTNKP